MTLASHVRSLARSNISAAAKYLTLFDCGFPKGFKSRASPGPAHHEAGNLEPTLPALQLAVPAADPAASEIDVAPLASYARSSLKSLNAGCRPPRRFTFHHDPSLVTYFAQ